MTATQNSRAKLAKVKLDLAKKYDHLSKIRKSKLGQAKAQRRAASYRHEAIVLARVNGS